ncbi:VOC family protein [Streptomyces sp. DT24]|uniref:VOC family protein n=1 Tax=unclassified Streptomyces TaxID=2593676 RepID=UPI0023B96415|nr:VOC family protein [Streptomyces sp. AM 4-1-1]WEH37171.1 VOC family protein [Streptomyces sp. AM 4-1-1]
MAALVNCPRFHLAVPVDDLDAAGVFYGEVLGCARGRSSGTWTDWDLYGHQLVTHLAPVLAAGPDEGRYGSVDGHQVPVPHFGVLLSAEDFHALAARIGRAGTPFVIEPYLRFAGEPAEQWTMFLCDPAGNALEFKAFTDDAQVFATDGARRSA